MPALIRRPAIKAGINTLVVEDRTGQQCTDTAVNTEKQDAGASENRRARLMHGKIPFQKEILGIGYVLVLWVATDKLVLIPLQCFRIDA